VLTLRLIRYALSLNLKQLTVFRASFAMEVLTSMGYAVVTLIFWRLVYGSVRPLPGWTIGQTYAFAALVELAFSLSYGLFGVTGKLWLYITNGRLDAYLVRPVDPRLLLILVTLRLERLVQSLPSVCLLLILAKSNGAALSTTLGAGAFFGLLLGAIVYACVQLAGSCAAYWLGKSSLLDELTDSLLQFSQYPHTIFPKSLQVVLLSALPLGWVASQPARILTGLTDAPLRSIAVAIGITVIWWGVQTLLWERGRRRYESANG
jgi:ABC-2 type transport system permease protein